MATPYRPQPADLLPLRHKIISRYPSAAPLWDKAERILHTETLYYSDSQQTWLCDSQNPHTAALTYTLSLSRGCSCPFARPAAGERPLASLLPPQNGQVVCKHYLALLLMRQLATCQILARYRGLLAGENDLQALRAQPNTYLMVTPRTHLLVTARNCHDAFPSEICAVRPYKECFRPRSDHDLAAFCHWLARSAQQLSHAATHKGTNAWAAAALYQDARAQGYSRESAAELADAQILPEATWHALYAPKVR